MTLRKVAAFADLLEHFGPGNHPSGSPQSDHSGGGMGASKPLGDQIDAGASRGVEYLTEKARETMEADCQEDFSTSVEGLLGWLGSNIGELADSAMARDRKSAIRDGTWYARVQHFAATLGGKYGVAPERVAAAISILSAQNVWTDQPPGKGKTEWSAGNATQTVELFEALADDRPFTLSEGQIQFAVKMKRDGSESDAERWRGKEYTTRQLLNDPDGEFLIVAGLSRLNDTLPADRPRLPMVMNSVFMRKAVRAVAGDAPSETVGSETIQKKSGRFEVGGPKTRAFYNAIATGGQTQDVTIDGHIGEAIFAGLKLKGAKKRTPRGSGDGGYKAASEILGKRSGRYYALGAEAFQASTKAFNKRYGLDFTPTELQALIWQEIRVRKEDRERWNSWKVRER